MTDTPMAMVMAMVDTDMVDTEDMVVMEDMAVMEDMVVMEDTAMVDMAINLEETICNKKSSVIQSYLAISLILFSKIIFCRGVLAPASVNVHINHALGGIAFMIACYRGNQVELQGFVDNIT